MKPLITMTPQQLDAARAYLMRDHNGAGAHVLAELDAQRAVPSPEPVEDGISPPFTPKQIAEFNADFEDWKAKWDAAYANAVDAAAVRRQAIEDCIAAVKSADNTLGSSAFHAACADGVDLAMRALEALREGESR